MPARSHFFLEPESSQAITALAGEGFADMVTRRLCFLDHRYAQAGLREEHGGGASAGPATNNRDIGFHPTLLLKTTPRTRLVAFEVLADIVAGPG